MGFFDRFTGRKDEREQEQAIPGQYQFGRQPPLDDEQALERYRYMLRTAPPETIEQAHLEAFAKLTPEQRQTVLRELADLLPEQERAANTAQQADPSALARLATRAEMRLPGAMERVLSGTVGTAGMNGLGGGGALLTSFAASFAGSMVAQQFFNTFHNGVPGLGEAGLGEALTATEMDDQDGELGGDVGDSGSEAGDVD